MTATTGRDPGELYRNLVREFGEFTYERIDAPATAAEKKILQRLSPQEITTADVAGDQSRASWRTRRETVRHSED